MIDKRRYYNVAAGFYGAAVENVTAPVKAAAHPVETTKSLCTIMAHPVQASYAIYGAGESFVSRISRGDPQAFGEALFAGISATVGIATRIGGVAESTTTVIGRVRDLQKLGPREKSLLDRLPNQGTPKANWRQNSSVLRQEMNRGLPIRDASPGDTGGQFLNAERNLLQDRGWTFDSGGNLWMPPKG